MTRKELFGTDKFYARHIKASAQRKRDGTPPPPEIPKDYLNHLYHNPRQHTRLIHD